MTSNSSPKRSALQPIFHRFELLKKVAKNSWLFTESDFFTFVIPNTVFGAACALAGAPLVSVESSSFGAVLSKIPSVILFNVRILSPSIFLYSKYPSRVNVNYEFLLLVPFVLSHK